MKLFLASIFMLGQALAAPQARANGTLIPIPNPFPPIIFPICRPPAQPANAGRLLAVVEFYSDNKCATRSSCQSVYEFRTPQCLFLAGNSFKLSYIYTNPQTNPQAPQSGALLVPFTDKFCTPANKQIILDNTRDCYSPSNQYPYPDASKMQTFQLYWYPTGNPVGS